MTSTVRLDENFFTCSICNDDYNDPRSLPCLHSFCRVCLCQHISFSAQRAPPSFLCPVCRQPTPVPADNNPIESWADLFPANFWLKDLMSQASSAGEASVGPAEEPQERTRCSTHPEQELCMFCTSCRVLVCNVCMVSKHIHCQFINLDKKTEWENRDLKTCVERLRNEIVSTQRVNNELENELTYLSRQREKARVAIESHAAKFSLMLDRAKRKLFSRLDADYHELKKDMDKQLSADNVRLQFLKRLNIDAREFIQSVSRPDASSQAGEITKKINEAMLLSRLEKRPTFERMRASFAPDFACLEKDLTLGTVAFYNAKVLASEDAAPTLTRSQSSVQLRRKVSRDSLFKRASVPDGLARHPSQEELNSDQSANDESSRSSLNVADNVLELRHVSVPYLQVDASQSSPRLGAMAGMRSEENLDTNQNPADPRDTVESRSRPSFFVEELESGEDEPDGDAEESSYMIKSLNSKMNQPNDGTPLIPSRVVSRISLISSEDGQIPDITGMAVLPDGQLMVADSANMSIKVVRNRSICFTIRLDDRPCGIAVASPDRVLSSLPISKGLVVVSVGSIPKIVTKLQVQRSYRTLMPYRSGIVAAACAVTCCIDLVTLQGKVMKQFCVGNHPVKSIPFCVDAKQEITLWDSIESSLVSVSKTGCRAIEGTCDVMKGKEVLGLAYETSGLFYALHDGRVAMVTRKGDHCGVMDNVFSCQCMCEKGSGSLLVVETGGECKELGF